MDATRPVIDNDGWEHTCGDLLTVHDYASTGELLRAHLGTLESLLTFRPAERAMYVGGQSYQGQPILLSEFGGVKYAPGKEEAVSWGYCEADSENAFEQKLMELFLAVRACKLLDGFCYTQLTDVETEQNGLLTYAREPKIPIESIRIILLKEMDC